MVMTEKKTFCCDQILPVGFIKQAGGLIVMVAELWMVKYFLPGRVVGRSYSRLSAPFPFCTKE